MSRTFTREELQKLLANATPGPWRGDRNDGTVKYAIFAGPYDDPIVVLSVNHKSGTYGFGCGYGDEDETRYGDDPATDERLCILAPDLAAFALSLLDEIARLRGALAVLGVMSAESEIPNTMRTVIKSALDGVTRG